MQMFDTLQGSFTDGLESMRAVQFLGNSLDQVLLALLIIVLGWAAARIFSFFLNHYAARLAKRTKNQLDDFAVETIRNLGVFIIVIVAFLYATRALTLVDEIDLFVGKAVGILLAIKITSSLLKIFDFTVNEYVVPYAIKSKILDKTIIPTLERIIKMMVWAVVILLIISNLGYNISSLLTGLGIGGLAIALAAQEALSNFFGSISIFADKTFKVGDYIQTSDIKGTVQAVGLRSTRVETIEGTEVIIPNSRLATQNIENLSRRPKRRVDLNLNLVYSTSNTKLKLAMKILKDVIKVNKATDPHCRIHFNEFGAYGLNVALTYWIKDIDLEAGQKVQNEINLKIKQEFEKAKIEFAFPTQTLFVHGMKK